MIQKIEIVRCTSNAFQIYVADANGSPYKLGDDEKIVMGVKAKATDKELLITKTATVDDVGVFRITLCPEDTENLAAGRYSYDVGLDDGTDFYNIVEPSPFVIIQNVTCRGCAE